MPSSVIDSAFVTDGESVGTFIGALTFQGPLTRSGLDFPACITGGDT